MTDYKRAGKAAIEGLRGAFHTPQVPLVTGVPTAKAMRYSRNAQDAAVYFAQIVAIERIPHRTLRGLEIQTYVDQAMKMPWPQWRQGEQWAVVVNVLPGAPIAEYRSGVVTVPTEVSELIVLHELAHHFAPVPVGPHGSRNPEHHGAAFIAAYLDLIEHVMNPAAAGAMRECLAMEGISV